MKVETTKNNVIIIALGLAVLFWILESAAMNLIFNVGTFWQQMFSPDLHEIWMRFLAMGIIIMFGAYAQSALAKRRRLAYALNERVKELQCIYDITDIAERPGIALDKLYQEAVSILPKGWQYPEITCARISVNGKMFEAENYKDTAQKLSSEFEVLGAKTGRVEIAYLEERPELDEGPFLREERLLIDAVAEQLGAITKRKQAEEELRKHRDHLGELVDNRTNELAKANQLLQGEIAERKRAEEKLQELYQLEQRLRRELEEQMGQRVEFTRALVHELKTPLTPMRAASELLIAQSQEDPYRSLAEKINRGVLNLNRRIDELLDLARGEIGMLELKCRLVDPLQLLHEVADYVAPEAAKKGHSFVLDLPLSLPALWCDQDRLRQVLLNLLNNAFKFTPEGGRVNMGARQKEDSLRVEVQDTGCGISKDKKKQLFKPYHQLVDDEEHFGGLGLGLALCKVMVELHGGQIWVESQKNKGSSFIFTIPLKKVTPKNTT
jgi:signal transduction histidine kinase